MSDNNDAVREELARRVAELEEREQELAAHVERLYEALAPFANAWQRRKPAGDPSTKSYQRRLERALGVFYSNGNIDDRALTGQHLQAAASTLSAPINIASHARLKAQWQAEGAAMVAESAWSRKHLEPFGITPQECAANLATLIANDLRRQSQEPAQ